MSDAYGPSNGAMLRRAVLLTAACGAGALVAPRWITAGNEGSEARPPKGTERSWSFEDKGVPKLELGNEGWDGGRGFIGGYCVDLRRDGILDAGPIDLELLRMRKGRLGLQLRDGVGGVVVP